jgi:hypothetical protein
MVMVAEIGAVPVLVAVNAGTLPVPLAARPIAVLLLDHAKVVPLVVELRVVSVELILLQNTWFATVLTVGAVVVLTVIV